MCYLVDGAASAIAVFIHSMMILQHKFACFYYRSYSNGPVANAVGKITNAMFAIQLKITPGYLLNAEVVNIFNKKKLFHRKMLLEQMTSKRLQSYKASYLGSCTYFASGKGVVRSVMPCGCFSGALQYFIMLYNVGRVLKHRITKPLNPMRLCHL